MKSILVAIDEVQDVTADTALIQRSMALARAFSSRVWLVHVVPRPGITPFNVEREVLRKESAAELRHEHAALQRLAGQLRARGIDATALMVQGPTVKTLIQQAERHDADIVLVTCHRHSRLYRALLEDAGQRLLQASSRPVLFVPQQQLHSAPSLLHPATTEQPPAGPRHTVN